VLWRWFGDPSTDSTRGDLLTGEIMNRAIDNWSELDEAEAEYELHRAKVLEAADNIENYGRDDILAMLGDASIGDMMNLKVLWLESLRGERKADWCARMDLAIEKVTEL